MARRAAASVSVTKKILTPVSVAGIEFDALIEENKTLSASIPAYPVEDGFPISDTIILEPLCIQMTLYVSNTPVTWLYRHGSSKDRVRQICDRIEKLWLERQLVKIVTNDAIYTDMGLTSISFKKSREIGYAREISLSAQKIRVTEQKAVEIPSYLMKSGETQANAGAASVSASSAKTAGNGTLGSSSKGNSNNKSSDQAKKSQSILYGVASGMGFI